MRKNEQNVNISLKIGYNVEVRYNIQYNINEFDEKRKRGEKKMVSRKLTVHVRQGVNVLPATVIAKTAEACKAQIEILHQNNIINAKSLLNILSATIASGDEVEIRCTGPDEDAAMAKMLNVIDSLE